MEIKKKKHVVVVGNGMTSLRFCEKLMEYDAFREYRITVLGEEGIPAYDRVALSSLFGGKTEQELILAESRWYDYQNIDLRLGVRVAGISRTEKRVTTKGDDKIDYDKLVLATGARPRIPLLGGTDLSGVYTYRTTNDVEAIRQHGSSARHAIVVGGGLLGLEAAEACKSMEMEVTVFETAPHLLACQLDPKGGMLLQNHVEALGINVRTNEQIMALEGHDEVESIRLENGETIPTDMVILAAGIQPNDELGRESGLEIGEKGGIAISETTRTSDPDIYAIGECASKNNTTFGLVAPCYAMAEAAAAHLGGINKTFKTSIPASQLKLFDIQVASIGNPVHAPSQTRHVVVQDPDRDVYKKMVTDTDGRRLLGAVLIGETSEFSRLQKRIEEGTELPEHPESLLAPIGSPFDPELEMADDDIVCYCSYVTKADIDKAIEHGNLKSTGEVMGTTYAASLCGSCLETVDAVTRQHLSRN